MKNNTDGRVGVAVLGSTGSVGTQALNVIEAHQERFRVVALAAGRNASVLQAQADQHGVPSTHARLCADAPESLAELAALPEVDVVINGVVGFAGLPATLAALRSGKRLGLANKESLIAAGPVVYQARLDGGGVIVPVDSEHSAIFQSMQAGHSPELRRILLTASGGPFRGKTESELEAVTIADALAHPTWSMGPKITVDSSTLMNKGLEVIEACELFNVSADAVEVVVHPQSIVHSMVEFVDGTTIAQLSRPDMRLPIAYALSYPERLDESRGEPSPPAAIDWASIGSLSFEAPDLETFVCLRLAFEAARRGGIAPAALSAANEISVEAFLDGRLSWIDIGRVNEGVLDDISWRPADSLEAVLEADSEGRALARNRVSRLER